MSNKDRFARIAASLALLGTLGAWIAGARGLFVLIWLVLTVSIIVAKVSRQG